MSGIADPVRRMRDSRGSRHNLPAIEGEASSVDHRARLVARVFFATVLGIALLAGVVSVSVDVPLVVRTEGVLEPSLSWPIRAIEPGLVVAVYVKPGDVVWPGDSLAQLDTLMLSEQRVQLETQARQNSIAMQRHRFGEPLERRIHEEELGRARAALMEARAEVRRHLAEYGISGTVDSILQVHEFGDRVGTDLVVARVQQAQSGWRSQSAQRDLAELATLDLRSLRWDSVRIARELAIVGERIRRSQLRSPGVGVVLTDDVRALVGALVSSGDLVFTVASLQRWRLVANVDQRGVHRVRSGDRAKIRVSVGSADGQRLDGIVGSVANEPVDGTSGSYRIVIDVTTPDVASWEPTAFRQGYRAEVAIVTRTVPVLSLLRERMGLE